MWRTGSLTTLLWVLIRVVSTVVLTITLPAQRLAQSVIALKLVQGAVSAHFRNSTERRGEKYKWVLTFIKCFFFTFAASVPATGQTTVCLLPPVSHFSSSLPSMQSASASQRQRKGMQWPFLHWNWSLSHFTSQPFWEQRITVGFFYSCDTAEIWPVEELTLPRLNRRHNHGPRHTSIARQCSDHWCRRTRSPNTAVALGRKQDNSWLRLRGDTEGQAGQREEGAKEGEKEKTEKCKTTKNRTVYIKTVKKNNSWEPGEGGSTTSYTSGRR